MHLMLIAKAVGAALLTWLFIFFFQQITSPLRSVPGPLVARLTNLWYYLGVKYESFEQENLELHRKYGRWLTL